MPSTYSPNLRIELIANGEQSGTWGTTTNTNLGTLIEDAIAGYVSVSITSADQALTANNGSADQSRNMVLNLTTTTTAPFNVYIPPAEKFYVVRNASAYNATIYCSTVLGNTTAAGLGVTVLANSTTIIFSDGTNVRVAIDSFSASSLVATNLTVNGNSTLGDTSSDTITLNGTVQPGVVISGSSSGDALRITQTGAGNAFVVEDSANPDATPFVVDSGGSVIRGYTTSVATVSHTGAAATPSIQNHGLSVSGSSYGSFTWVASAVGPNFVFSKSRGASAGTQAVVASGDLMGGLTFAGDDGAAFVTGASITALVDGTPGTNDMPGRLVFSTTADGASSPTERMRISNDGSVSIGFASSGTFGLRIGRNATGGASFNGQLIQQVIQSDVTSRYTGIYSNPSTAAAAFTLSTLEHFRTDGVTLGSGSAVTNQYGFHASSALTAATNNYGFFGNLAAASGAWNLYMSGTANNYMAGALGIGATSLTGYNVYISKNITGATSAYNMAVNGTVQSDVTTAAYGVATFLQTQAAAFTLGTLRHFSASQGTIGATSAVTNQFGFEATSSLTGATNDYGFYSNIASGTGRWNFYANGTADNYFAGNVGIGTTSPGAALDVEGLGDTVAAHIFTSDNVLNATASLVFGTTPGARSKASVSMVNTSTGNGAGALVLSTNNGTSLTERLRIDSSGNVGIGTSSPNIQTWRSGTYLTVANASTRGQIEIDGAVADSSSASLGALIFTYSTNTTNHKDVALIEAISSGATANQRGGVLNFYTKANGTAAPALNMTLDASGNLGIGTTSPATRLHVKGASGTTSLRLEPSTSTTIYTQVRGVNGDLYLEADAGNAEGSSSMLFTVDGTERARFNSTGAFVLAGGTTTADGIGITFPATQSASSNANTLDDYEEGTFTPLALGSTTGGTASYTVQIGRYTKIGNRVFYSLYINYSGGTGSGFMRIGGLPFTSNSTANNYSMGSIYFSNLALTANNIALALVANNDTTISINQTPAGGGAAADVNYDAAALILVSGHYGV